MLLYKGGLVKSIHFNPEGAAQREIARYTTYGVGGKANAVFLPRTPYELKCVYDFLCVRGGQFVVLGNGSNVLASDKDFAGSVICTRKMSGIVRLSETKVCCLAGTKLSSLIDYCLNEGLGGVEYLYGIPATVGGAAFMNAGVQNHSFGGNIEKVAFYNGKRLILNNCACNFGYRRSTMRNIDGVILWVAVSLKKQSRSQTEEKLQHFKARRAHLPKGRSCGCVFKNGEGYFSAQLIDWCGLKGLKIGGARVSPSHANFIINESGTAADVALLICEVKRRVFAATGITLNEEVVYIGDFNDING